MDEYSIIKYLLFKEIMIISSKMATLIIALKRSLKMNNLSPVFVFNSLNTKRGGMTKATIHRANILVNEYENTQFLTILFQKNHENIINNLYKTGELDPKVKVYNLFRDLDPSKGNLVDLRKKANANKEEEGLIAFNAKNAYRYYKDGFYVMYKKIDGKGQVSFIDYMNEGRHRIRREEYNEDGYVVRERYMDLITNTPKLDRYFGKDGNCYLSTWVNPKTEEVSRCNLFFPEPLEFSNLEELAAYWVKTKVEKIISPILIADNPQNHSLLLNKKLTAYRKIVVMHTNHYDLQEDGSFELSQQYNSLFKHKEKYQNVVFLTEEQLQDFTGEFGGHLGYRVIPHGIDKPFKDREDDKVNSYLAVTLARYHKEKGLEDGIRAFRNVVDVIPDAIYEIYGIGEHEQYFQDLIKELKLENNVKLQGFTDNKIEVFQKAACTIMTSKSEGFGLTILESLAAGTPVVSYNIKYGPKDMIVDGKNGYLVENQQELAEKIIGIMTEDRKRKKLSKHTKSIFKSFGHEQFLEKWIKLLEE